MQRVPGTLSWPKGMRGSSAVVCCMGGPLRARASLKMVHLMGGQSVARPALFLFTVRHYEHLMTATRSRDAFLGVTKSRVQSFSAVVCMGRPLRAHVLIEILRILMGERSVAHPELRALFDVPL